MRAAAFLLLVAISPFTRNHPKVAEGMAAYEAGRYEEALKAFEEAQKELPDSAVLEFNRGNALYKLGRLEEAKAAYSRAAKSDDRELLARDYYNFGNAQAQLGQREEAIKAYRRALALNPKDADARHNLEVMLRNVPPPQPPNPSADGGTDGGSPDGGQDGGTPQSGQDGGLGGPDGGADGGTGADGGARQSGGGAGRDGGAGDAGQKGERETPSEDDRRDAGTRGQDEQAQDDAEEGRDGGFEEPANLDRKEAERLLDSMRRNEKSLQMWRFQQKKKRKTNEKDW